MSVFLLELSAAFNLLAGSIATVTAAAITARIATTMMSSMSVKPFALRMKCFLIFFMELLKQFIRLTIQRKS